MMGQNESSGNKRISAPTQIPGKWTNLSSANYESVRQHQITQRGDVMFALAYVLG